MLVLILRPFGKVSEIDFDRLDRDLIRPAVEKLGITHILTGDITEGSDAMQPIGDSYPFVADIVIADVSLANPNVLYELGVRHAVRPGQTVVLRCQDKAAAAAWPNALEDRCVVYEANHPGTSAEELASTLREDIGRGERASPVLLALRKMAGMSASAVAPNGSAGSDEDDPAEEDEE